jgi:hypothetical protein
MLNASLGRPPLSPVPALDGMPSASVPVSVDAARAAALDGRPELRAGGAEVGRAQAEVSVMQSMFAPMALVRTGPAYTMTDGPGWMVMIGVSGPIWRGKLRAGVAEAEARPMLMTVLANVFGLLPILVERGVGADVAKRIAAPMWGGLLSLTILTLLVIPAVYVVWRSFELRASSVPAGGG